jgi:MHS family proline/betaine transporter-like MFS transporter
MLTWKQRCAVLAGNTFEFYDIAVYAAIAPYITEIFEKEGISNATILTWGIFALRFLIRPLGGAIVGWFADKHGRKNALVLTSSLTGMTTLMMAVLPVHYNWQPLLPILLLILQMLQALSFGGEYPTIISYLLKEEKKSSIVSAEIVASSVAGVILSLIVTLILSRILNHAQMLDFGWRIPLILGAVNIAISFWFRWRLATDQPSQKNGVISGKRVARIFLLTIPSAVVFYVQSLSVTVVKNTLPTGCLQSLYPLLSNFGLFTTLILAGYIVQCWSSTKKAMKIGVILLIVLAAPLYAGLGTATTWLIIVSQILLTIIAAMILSNLAALLFDESLKSQHQTAELGLGYNLALSIFGGLSPLITATLLPINHVYLGIYVACSGLAFFAARYLPEKGAKTNAHGK